MKIFSKTSAMTLGVVAAAGMTFLGASATYAHDGGPHPERYRLIPEEMRAEFQAEFKTMSPKERQVWMQAHADVRQDLIADVEEFTGLDRTMLKERWFAGEGIGELLTEQGITVEETEEFLTDEAHERIDIVAERHDLSEEDVVTLRDRVGNFVDSIIKIWFN